MTRTDRERVERAAKAGGLATFPDAFDRGILRVHVPRVVASYGQSARIQSGRLVGLVVIRNDRVTYAEHRGRVFAFWPGTYRRTLLRLIGALESEADQ